MTYIWTLMVVFGLKIYLEQVALKLILLCLVVSDVQVGQEGYVSMESLGS